jgi:hypothetical protein
MSPEINLSCTKCSAKMEEGFILDATRGGWRVANWISGAPVKSFWRGLNLRGKQPVPLRAFRCMACGYVESYAK